MFLVIFSPAFLNYYLSKLNTELCVIMLQRLQWSFFSRLVWSCASRIVHVSVSDQGIGFYWGNECVSKSDRPFPLCVLMEATKLPAHRRNREGLLGLLCTATASARAELSWLFAQMAEVPCEPVQGHGCPPVSPARCRAAFPARDATAREQLCLMWCIFGSLWTLELKMCQE